ncbi:septum site-determining protein MinC [Polaromonas eurypsychrophila]|uniref:Probable septum site-determining protein MinC n=1 Tax=Polaromonas eurypsychrophila TaxID=1614635 RepID=A0A916WDD7_9BURK|nr:septum site-determining protein MinC [Polaromonas eurypsychrophila]GGA89568.1 putative septum site-determining protein MinC [Polaromonas eurypsychrophila]
MTVALPASSPATFEIKSANLPLVALLLKSTDLDALSRDLALRFGDIPDFFDNDPLVVELSALASDGRTIDFAALVTLLRSYRVAPVAVRGGDPEQMNAAAAAGLLVAPDARITAARTQTPEVARAQPAAAEAPVAAPAAGALVIDRPLRSGQQVYARGRDLVMLAMVNAGAEVIADGHIHVYAPLRGKAMAGARGNADARIFSLCLEPELLSIAGIYRTSDVPLPKGVWGKPTQVRLLPGPDGDKLVMTPLSE